MNGDRTGDSEERHQRLLASVMRACASGWVGASEALDTQILCLFWDAGTFFFRMGSIPTREDTMDSTAASASAVAASSFPAAPAPAASASPAPLSFDWYSDPLFYGQQCSLGE